MIYKASSVMVKGESFKFKYCLGFWILGAYFDMIRQGYCAESTVSFRVQNIYISYSMKIECNWFMLGKKFMSILWKSSIVVRIIFCFFSCQHGLCCDWWNWENLVEFKATTLLNIIRQEENSFLWNNICCLLLLEP